VSRRTTSGHSILHVPAARRRRSVAVRAVLLAVAMLATPLGGRATSVGGEPPAAESPPVTLKGGRTLLGRVDRTRVVDGKPFLVVATDFGEILVPQGELASPAAPRPEPPASESTFVTREVRVVRIEGAVLRRRPGEPEWTAISEETPYSGRDRGPTRVSPGDSLRTGPSGLVDVLLHRDVWVRVANDSEIEIPATAGAASLVLLRGSTVQDVRSRPRGEVFRVATPSAVLGVRGTRFRALASPSQSGVAVREGTVEVEGRAKVAAGEEARWGPGRTFVVTPITPDSRDALAAADPIALPIDDMVYVPAGRYHLGVSSREPIAADTSRGSQFSNAYERAQELIVGGFLIDRREVTLGDFAAYLAATGASIRDRKVPRKSGIDRQPMYDTSYEEAVDYATWVGKKLPTATQWEAAARGRGGRLFPWGSKPSQTPLVMGTWRLRVGVMLAGSEGALSWQPPDVFADVEASTPDVSAFGVEALASGVPEYVRHDLEAEPIWPLLTHDFRTLWTRSATRWDGTPSLDAVRGVGGSVLSLCPVAWDAKHRPGFRCVLELPQEK